MTAVQPPAPSTPGNHPLTTVDDLLKVKKATAGTVLLAPGQIEGCLLLKSGIVHEFEPGHRTDEKPLRQLRNEGVLGVEYFTDPGAFYSLTAIAASEVEYVEVTHETLHRANGLPVMRAILMHFMQGSDADLRRVRIQLSRQSQEIAELEQALETEAQTGLTLREEASRVAASAAESNDTVQQLLAALAAEQAKSARLEKDLSVARGMNTSIRALNDTLRQNNRDLEKERDELQAKLSAIETLEKRVDNVENKVEKQGRAIEQVRTQSEQNRLQLAAVAELANLVRMLELTTPLVDLTPLLEQLMSASEPELQLVGTRLLRVVHMIQREGTSPPPRRSSSTSLAQKPS
jgi:hypothetical protein